MEQKEGFKVLFEGTNMDNWIGNTQDHVIGAWNMVIYPGGGQENLYTNEENCDFDFRFDFKLTSGTNNGLGKRAPLKGDAAYEGIEQQF